MMHYAKHFSIFHVLPSLVLIMALFYRWKWRHKDPEKLPYVGDADYTAGKSRFVQVCAV